jgi:putative transcriptional regulator
MRNKVREERADRGISQAALGDALGVSRQTINAIETGRYMPSLPLAFGLARFFETSIEGLFEPDKGDFK